MESEKMEIIKLPQRKHNWEYRKIYRMREEAGPNRDDHYVYLGPYGSWVDPEKIEKLYIEPRYIYDALENNSAFWSGLWAWDEDYFYTEEDAKELYQDVENAIGYAKLTNGKWIPIYTMLAILQCVVEEEKMEE